MNAFDTYVPWLNTGVNPDRCDFTWLFKRECAHCLADRNTRGVAPFVDEEELGDSE